MFSEIYAVFRQSDTVDQIVVACAASFFALLAFGFVALSIVGF